MAFLDLLNNKLLKNIIRYMPLFSLLITNFIVLLIFSHFFTILIKSWNFWIFFIIGFLFSLITIKTNYVLYFKTKDKLEQKEEAKKNTDIPKIGVLNSIIILIKNLFFNILNDLFILIIIWSVLFSVFYFLGFINSPNDFNHLATTIILIGVLSGFFQFYIKDYKEKVSLKIANSISQYVIKILRKISLEDFMKELDEDNKESIQQIISSKEEFKEYRIGFRPKPFTLIDMPFMIKDTSVFDNIDYIIEEKLVKNIQLDSNKLNSLYKKYFDKKFQDFKEKVNQKDLIETKKLLFSHLIFFDEIVADLEKISLEFSFDENLEEPKGFREHYEKFSYDCVYYILDVLLNLKENSNKEDEK